MFLQVIMMWLWLKHQKNQQLPEDLLLQLLKNHLQVKPFHLIQKSQLLALNNSHPIQQIVINITCVTMGVHSSSHAHPAYTGIIIKEIVIGHIAQIAKKAQ